MQNKIISKRELVTGIITGVSSTLIIMWFIEPLAKWLFPKLLILFDKFSLSFSNSFYQDVSSITAGSLGTYDVSLSIILVYMVMLTYMMFSQRLKKKFNKIINKQIEQIESPLKDTSDDTSASLSPKKEISASSLRKEQKFVNIVIRVIFILGIYSILIMFYLGIRQIYAYSISSNTTLNIEIVAPYISDLEYKQLKSDFYTIESKEDFDIITESLNSIAEENSLSLKK